MQVVDTESPATLQATGDIVMKRILSDSLVLNREKYDIAKEKTQPKQMEN